ncbi:hypothetical protein ILUMI_08757 [Ignelater luminosus]|uniref:RNA-directed DNA polymerase n=1 Tax=Ignelater luminosus TaxID=2038154 RepID=A0A8K0D558_IGNLU|nr:hypothetical protein ILUMI_08757 [Ignelater luminosus]
MDQSPVPRTHGYLTPQNRYDLLRSPLERYPGLRRTESPPTHVFTLQRLHNETIKELTQEEETLAQIEPAKKKIRMEARTPLPYSETSSTIHSNENEELRKPIETIEEPIDKMKTQLIIETTLFPTMFTIQKATLGRQITTIKLPKEQTLQEKQENLKKILKQQPQCTTRIDVLEEKQDQEEQISIQHEGRTNHRGIDEGLKQLKRHYWWPHMQESVTHFINKCELSNKTKYDRRPIKPIMQLPQTYKKPFEHVQIDTFQIQGKKFLTLVDKFSKFRQAIKVGFANAIEIAEALVDYFSHLGGSSSRFIALFFRNYKRKTERKNLADALPDEAKALLSRGLSLRATTSSLAFSEGALRKRLMKETGATGKGNSEPLPRPRP